MNYTVAQCDGNVTFTSVQILLHPVQFDVSVNFTQAQFDVSVNFTSVQLDISVN